MIKGKKLLEFYKGKKVLVTGSTGFKGAWLSLMLHTAGAQVCGYALRPDNTQLLFEKLELEKNIKQIYSDIRNFEKLAEVFNTEKPEFVFHLAAQPLVRESYLEPRYTFEANVMGTVNILECIRQSGSVKSFLNVTTDKVYDNKEVDAGYKEEDRLDGYDPYSNSKSCSELVTHSYAKSFLYEEKCAVSTARAGNVIGGGDYAKDRIIPDCVRAAVESKSIIIRNPDSIRPYQHVLEPLYVYLMIAANQGSKQSLCESYNVGPDDADCESTLNLVKLFCDNWGKGMDYTVQPDGGPHEAGFLKLDCTKLKTVFDWKPVYNIKEAVCKTVEWHKRLIKGEQAEAICISQIKEFYNLLL